MTYTLIRTKTKIPLARQVREAVRDYCDILLEGKPPKTIKQKQEYQIKTELKFKTPTKAIKEKGGERKKNE